MNAKLAKKTCMQMGSRQIITIFEQLTNRYIMRDRLKQINILAILVLLCSLTTMGQSITPGIAPKGYSDCMTNLFHSKVKSCTEKTYAADFSRHIAEKGYLTNCVEKTYDENGNILTERTFDESGEKLTGTLYQYRDSMKYVTTTHNAQGARTLQILYEENSDGQCTKMRMTDAFAITICVTRIRHEENYVKTTDTYTDGEIVNTEYIFNKDKTLSQIIKDGDYGHTTTLSYGIKVANVFGQQYHPKKMTIESNNGEKTIYNYEYEVDSHAEWKRRITYCDGKAIEITERTIEYWE